MKAAVLHKVGDIPRFGDFPDPVPDKDEVLIRVKAVVLDNAVKVLAEGEHFASGQFFSKLPAIVGFDGIGELSDGQTVGFGGMEPPYGAMAEKVVVPKGNTVPIPENVDAVTAAALPKSALTSLFPLKWGVKLKPGETVFINGATGVSGKLAVQIAKLLGAERVIGTGRNPESMKQVKELGADKVIDLKQSDEELMKAFRKVSEEGIDVILDFLWGHPTEILVRALIPEQLSFAKRRVRLVQIGEKAGETITLPAGALRTSGLEILGASAGLIPEAIAEGTDQVWEWIKADQLQMDIEKVSLKNIEEIWSRSDFQGQRIVIVP